MAFFGGSGGTDVPFTTPKITTGIKDANGNLIVGFTPTTNADDYINITNGTSSVTIAVVGADASPDLIIAGKGAGTIAIGQGAAYTGRVDIRNGGSAFLSVGSNGTQFFAVNANSVLVSASNLDLTTNDFYLRGVTTGAVTRNLIGMSSGDVVQVATANNNTQINGSKVILTGGVVSNYKGADVASAAAIVPTGNVFHVTGTTSITSITATNITAGTILTLIFDGVLTFTDGNNLKLAGDFVTTADDTITLVYDGTNFYEVARSVN